MHPDPRSSSLASSVIFLGSMGLFLLAGISCSTTPDQSSGIVATPVAPTEVKSEDQEKSEEAPAELAKLTEEPVPPAEKPKDAATLAAEAKALVSWSSSQSSLEKAFALSGEAADLAPSDSSIALQHAEHAVRLAQTASGIDRPAEIAKEALASMNAAGLSGSNLNARSAYYRGSLSGLIMRAQGLAAAGKLPELEKLFQQASSSPDIEQGGPLRALGMLYLKAPPWPTGIGDFELALENLEKAAASYGDFPYSHICLAHAFAEDGRAEEARQALAKAEALLTSQNFGALGSAWRREIAEIRSNLN